MGRWLVGEWIDFTDGRHAFAWRLSEGAAAFALECWNGTEHVDTLYADTLDDIKRQGNEWFLGS